MVKERSGIQKNEFIWTQILQKWESMGYVKVDGNPLRVRWKSRVELRVTMVEN